MTCSHCGNPLAQGAHFCSACGTQVTAQTSTQPRMPAGFVPATPYAYPPPAPDMRVSRNLQSLGTLWLVYAVVRALTGLAAILFVHGFFGSHLHGSYHFGWSPFGREGADAFVPIAIVSLATSVGLAALTGYALLTRQPWGRIFAIIFGILALFHFPFGTALGIFTLWTLAPGRSGDEYASLSYSAQRL